MLSQIYCVDFSHCVPICKNCLHGECTAPQTCNCANGYRWHNASAQCKPVCQSGCLHGICVAPETCECNSGYAKIENSTGCEPRCEPVCYLGKCIAVDTCVCLEGYHFANGSVTICEPHCKVPCSTNSCTMSPLVCDDNARATMTITETAEVTQPDAYTTEYTESKQS